MAKMAAISDDCERTATVALPTAASPGFISGEVGISAALDAFSTVYGLPLLNAFWDGQTNRHTDMNDRYTSLYALRPREVKTVCHVTDHVSRRDAVPTSSARSA